MANSSEPSLTELPTPDHITLLFKCHKSTTLLSVAPTQSFSSVKHLLLTALKSRNLTTFPNSSTPLPTNAEDLEFGVLADRRDASKGWVALETKDADTMKKKLNTKKSGGGGSNATPAGTGLVDGCWIAYRLRSTTTGPVKDEDESDDSEMVDVPMADDPEWDVVLPSFEDEAD